MDMRYCTYTSHKPDRLVDSVNDTLLLTVVSTPLKEGNLNVFLDNKCQKCGIKILRTLS
jgi:hypothetical protein